MSAGDAVKAAQAGAELGNGDLLTVAHCAIAAIGGGWIGEAGVVVMVGALDAGVRCIGIIEAWRRVAGARIAAQ